MHRLIRKKKRSAESGASLDAVASVLLSNLKHARYLHQQGQLKAAQKLYQQILNIDSEHSEANHLLGMTWVQIKDFDEAYTFLAKAAQLEPENLDYLNNFAAITLHLGDHTEAIKILQKVIAKNPKHVDAQCNLGISYIATGQFQEAMTAAHCALEENPHSLRAQTTLLQAITFEYPAHAWDTLLSKEIYPFHQQPCNEKVILQAMSRWMNGNVKQANLILSQFQPLENTDASMAPKQIAAHLKQSKDVSFLQTIFDLPNKQTKVKKRPMYVIGDLQCVAYHGQAVTFNETQYQLQAIYLKGIKALHLAKNKINPYQECLQLRLNELLEESTLLFQLGRLDLHPVEGIFSQRDNQRKDLISCIHEITSGYIKRIKSIEKNRPFEIYIAGPSTFQLTAHQMDEKQVKLYYAMIEEFNQSLQSQSLQAGFPYLDLYHLTSEDPTLLLDKEHLRPNTLQVAFNELSYGKNS